MKQQTTTVQEIQTTSERKKPQPTESAKPTTGDTSGKKSAATDGCQAKGDAPKGTGDHRRARAMRPRAGMYRRPLATYRRHGRRTEATGDVPEGHGRCTEGHGRRTEATGDVPKGRYHALQATAPDAPKRPPMYPRWRPDAWRAAPDAHKLSTAGSRRQGAQGSGLSVAMA